MIWGDGILASFYLQFSRCCIILSVMETDRLERQPTVGELRWYAASICRVVSHRLEQKREKPTDENIREYVKSIWEDRREREQLQHDALLLRKSEIEEVARKYPNSAHPDVKAQVELIDRYRHAKVDSLEIVGDIILKGEEVLHVERSREISRKR